MLSHEAKLGNLLVASPKISDFSFREKIILIVEADNGHIGIVLNKPTNDTLVDLWSSVLPEEKIEVEGRIYTGGPCRGPISALHEEAEFGEDEIVPGIYFSKEQKNLKKIIHSNKRFRYFSGYTGWQENQLKKEIDMGGWLLTNSSADLLFSPIDEESSRDPGWEAALKQANQSCFQLLKIDSQSNPKWN